MNPRDSFNRPPADPPEPAGFWAQLKQQVKASLPTQAELERHRWLKPVATHLADPGLWRLREESVARGVAIGVFWAFVIPIAQILFAAAHCVWWRGNIPVAAGVTLITNPLTIGFWLWLAYHVGGWLVPASAQQGTVAPVGVPAGTPADAGWLAWIGSFGLPTLVGMGAFAIGGAVLGYLLTRLGARMWTAWRWRRVLARRAGRRPPV